MRLAKKVLCTGMLIGLAMGCRTTSSESVAKDDDGVSTADAVEWTGPIDQASSWVKDALYVFAMQKGSLRAGQSLSDAFDDEPISVSKVTLEDAELIYIRAYSGDTEVGPIMANGTSLEIVGENGDGDFAFYKQDYIELDDSREIFTGPFSRLFAIHQKQVELYLMSNGAIMRDGDPRTAVDEDNFTVMEVNAGGNRYHYIRMYSGDTENGPLYKFGTTELVGTNGDGDFNLTKLVYVDENSEDGSPGSGGHFHWEGPMTEAPDWIQNALSLYAETIGGNARGEPLTAHYDEAEPLFVQTLTLDGARYVYIRTYSGDTEVGPIVRGTNNTEIVGENGDGDFALYRDEYVTVESTREIFSGRFEQLYQLHKDRVRGYLESTGAMARNGDPVSVVDEDTFGVIEITIQGTLYDYIKMYSGDTEHGGIFQKDSRRMLGTASDGDFALRKLNYTENVEFDDEI